MKIKMQIAMVLMVLSSFYTFAQEKVYFPLFEVLNVNVGYRYSTSRLLKTYVDNNNKYLLILPHNSDSAYPKESFEETKNNAKLRSAPYFMIGQLNGLNNVMIVSITLYNTETGQKVWNDILKAATPDDLDPIFMRVAKALGTNEKAAQAGDIYSVTQYESPELNKITATTNWGVYIGGNYTFYPGQSNNTSAGFGLIFSYDLRDIILTLNGEYYFGTVPLYDIKLTTIYPFRQTKNTPFIGASLGYGGQSVTINQPANYQNVNPLESNTASGSGLIFFVNGGYIISRTANVHMDIWASIVLPTYSIQNKYPLGLMFNVAFLF